MELEILEISHEELTDTDVRESLHLTFNHYFVWGNEQERLPVTYGMFSQKGDHSIAKIVNTFLSEVSEASKVPVGKERLDFLQNRLLITPIGNHYEYFIGDTDEQLPLEDLPQDPFEPGDYSA